MEKWILEIMNNYGYLGMALLILAENLFPPIPSEVILTFGGFMTTYTKMAIPGAVLSATAGQAVFYLPKGWMPFFPARPEEYCI